LFHHRCDLLVLFSHKGTRRATNKKPQPFNESYCIRNGFFAQQGEQRNFLAADGQGQSIMRARLSMAAVGKKGINIVSG